MPAIPETVSLDLWLRHMFSSQQAIEGGVVRRKLLDVDRIVGRDRFVQEVERRGFTALVNAGQVVVFCNREPPRRLR